MPSFTPEWRLLDPVADLEALRLYLDTVEEQLAFLQDQWQVRLTADLSVHLGWSPGPVPPPVRPRRSTRRSRRWS